MRGQGLLLFQINVRNTALPRKELNHVNLEETLKEGRCFEEFVVDHRLMNHVQLT